MSGNLAEKLKDFGLLFLYYLWYTIKTCLIYLLIFVFIFSILLPLIFINKPNLEWSVAYFILPYQLLFAIPIIFLFMMTVRLTGIWPDPTRHKKELNFFGVAAYVILFIPVLFAPWDHFGFYGIAIIYLIVLILWFCIFRAYQKYRDRRNPDRDLEEEED